MLHLDALGNFIGLQQAVVVAILYVGDRSPKTAVTGNCLRYCVYFRVKQLYSNRFVPKTARVCVVLAAFLMLF